MEIEMFVLKIAVVGQGESSKGTGACFALRSACHSPWHCMVSLALLRESPE